MIILIIWLILKIFVFVCVAWPCFGSWEKNIQVIKEIKNIDSFDYLINSENICIYLCSHTSLWKLREIYSKNQGNQKYWSFDNLIKSENICFCLCCLTSLWKLREKKSKNQRNQKYWFFWLFDYFWKFVFSFLLPFQSLEAKRKIFKISKISKILIL